MKLCAVVYQDDGPVGMCPSAAHLTQPWTRVYVFSNAEEAAAYIEQETFRDMHSGYFPRKNARWKIVTGGRIGSFIEFISSPVEA